MKIEFSVFKEPDSEYLLVPLIVMGMILVKIWPGSDWFLVAVSLMGAIPTLTGAFAALQKLKITIDTFNFFALAVSFATGELFSGAFIVLMILFARLLEWFTEDRATKAVRALLKLKPNKASIEDNGKITEIPVDKIKLGDVILVRKGQRVPVDGQVVYGEAHLSEAPITGEPNPIRKVVGDTVYALSLSQSGVIRVKATKIGKDSTVERIADLIKEGARNKSKPEKLADRFATIFMPVVLVVGALTWIITGNHKMTVALFLVACADDMAVAIPLAVTAALRRAARFGVVVKGGRWLDALGEVKTIIFDKTGTLTYGSLGVKEAKIVEGVDRDRFWCAIAVAEKFSEHPIGRALFREAISRCPWAEDPRWFNPVEGMGVVARMGTEEIVVGGSELFSDDAISGALPARQELAKIERGVGETIIGVVIDGGFIGHVIISDTPRPEAISSLAELKALGVQKLVMFTGDNKVSAERTARALGIDEVHAGMKPEDKLALLLKIKQDGRVAMIGDGINDAPALAAADVGLAMGGGTAVAVESADMALVSDDLNRLPLMIRLARQTRRVVNRNTVIWLLTNAVGFALVFAGLIGPALAALYNFATDFLPLMNSMTMFKTSKYEK